MNHLDFVLWMLLYPFFCSVANSYRMKVTGITYSDTVQGISALITIIFWLYVGSILWGAK